eukprot:5552855-Pleurochrysis_carterae.AAC.1
MAASASTSSAAAASAADEDPREAVRGRVDTWRATREGEDAELAEKEEKGRRETGFDGEED